MQPIFLFASYRDPDTPYIQPGKVFHRAFEGIMLEKPMGAFLMLQPLPGAALPRRKSFQSFQPTPRHPLFF